MVIVSLLGANNKRKMDIHSAGAVLAVLAALAALAAAPEALSLLTEVVMHEAEPIVDRKSVFVGRACHISNPTQVRRSMRMSQV